MAKKKTKKKTSINGKVGLHFNPPPLEPAELVQKYLNDKKEIEFQVDSILFADAMHRTSTTVWTKDDEDYLNRMAMQYKQQSQMKNLHTMTRNEYQSLFADYQIGLYRFDIAETRENALKRDLIDIRELSDAIKKDISLQLRHAEYFFSASDAFFAVVPCFRKGTILEPRNSAAVYEITSIDVENMEYTVKVADYEQEEDAEDWQIANSYTMTIRTIITKDTLGNDVVKYNVTSKPETVFNRIRFQRSLNLAGLGFDESQKFCWNTYISRLMCWNAEKMFTATGLPDFLFSQFSFLHNIAAINMILAEKAARKPAAEKKKLLSEEIQNAENAEEENSEQQYKIVVHGTPEETPARVVRTVGLVSFASVTAPHKPTRKNIIKYITPVWSVRGHVRHYKSGKKAYIPPHVNHRRTFKNRPDADAPQQIIRIVNNKPIPEE